LNKDALEELLTKIKDGEVSVGDALTRLKSLPFEDLGFAKPDHHRSLRCGFPEVIFCQDKSSEDVLAIADKLYAQGGRLLATRLSEETAGALRKKFPTAKYYERARVVAVSRDEIERTGLVTIVTAGTSDIPVAEEARVTAEIMGANVTVVYDIGVAGIHRVLDAMEELQRSRVLVVVAGMEGALASVVGGLVDVPVIAVPTSVGYGASFGGIAPLLTMLNSCAAGVAVVNIDNGFGAGYIAALINSLPQRNDDEKEKSRQE